MDLSRLCPVAVRSAGDGCGWIAVTLAGRLSPDGTAGRVTVVVTADDTVAVTLLA